MNPVKNIMAEAASWDRFDDTRALAQSEGEFGRFFETARLDIAEPVKGWRGQRYQDSQDRLEKVDCDQPKPVQEACEIPRPEAIEPQKDLEQDRNPMSEPEVEESNNEPPVEQAESEDNAESNVRQSTEEAKVVTVEAPVALSKDSETVPMAANNVITKEQAGPQTGQSDDAAGCSSKGQNQPKNLQNPLQITELKANVQNQESSELINQPKQANDENVKPEKPGLNTKVELQVQSSKLPALNSEKEVKGSDGKLMAEGSKIDRVEVRTEGPQKSEEGTDQKTNIKAQGNSPSESQTTNYNHEESFNNDREARQKAQRIVTIQPPAERAESGAAVTFSGRITQEEGKTDQGWSGNTLVDPGKSVVSEKAANPNSLNTILNLGKPVTAGSTEMQENVDRIVKAAKASVNNGSARIQIRLEPPDLGYLRVEIKQSGNGWHLLLQATNVKAQQLLQQNSSELQAALESHGIQTRQIEVQLRLDLSDDYSPGEDQEAYQQQSSSEHTESYDQFNGDGSGQGSPEPSSAEEGNEQNPPTAVIETTTNKQWQALEFGRLDVQV